MWNVVASHEAGSRHAGDAGTTGKISATRGASAAARDNSVSQSGGNNGDLSSKNGRTPPPFLQLMKQTCLGNADVGLQLPEHECARENRLPWHHTAAG